MATATYSSQQSTFVQQMISFLQNPNNWPNNQPLITDFNVGSVTYTILSAIAAGLDQIGLQFFNAQLQASINTATGSNLDDICANWGVTRKPAIAANGMFTFVKNVPGPTNIVIPKGTVISTLPDMNGNTIQYGTDQDVTLNAWSSSVSVSATCMNPGPGSSGNLSSNVLVVLGSAVTGIDGVQLNQSITNGIDTESDDALRSRCLQIIQNPQVGGTIYDYQQWALSVTSVTTASVLPLNRGPGTVDIVITASNGVPSADLISQVQSVVDSNKPINVDARVLGPTTVTINFATLITPAPGYTISSLTLAVQNALINYLSSIPTGGTLYGSHLVSEVLKIAGVLDCQITMTINGINYSNFKLSSNQVASPGTITVQGM